MGIDHYFNASASADYVEMMTEFTDRVQAQLEAIKAERDKITVPCSPFVLEHCIPNDYGERSMKQGGGHPRSACV